MADKSLDILRRKLSTTQKVAIALIDENAPCPIVERKLADLEDLIAFIPSSCDELIEVWEQNIVLLWTRYARRSTTTMIDVEKMDPKTHSRTPSPDSGHSEATNRSNLGQKNPFLEKPKQFAHFRNQDSGLQLQKDSVLHNGDEVANTDTLEASFCVPQNPRAQDIFPKKLDSTLHASLDSAKTETHFHDLHSSNQEHQDMCQDYAAAKKPPLLDSSPSNLQPFGKSNESLETSLQSHSSPPFPPPFTPPRSTKTSKTSPFDISQNIRNSPKSLYCNVPLEATVRINNGDIDWTKVSSESLNLLESSQNDENNLAKESVKDKFIFDEKCSLPEKSSINITTTTISPHIDDECNEIINDPNFDWTYSATAPSCFELPKKQSFTAKQTTVIEAQDDRSPQPKISSKCSPKKKSIYSSLLDVPAEIEQEKQRQPSRNSNKPSPPPPPPTNIQANAQKLASPHSSSKLEAKKSISCHEPHNKTQAKRPPCVGSMIFVEMEIKRLLSTNNRSILPKVEAKIDQLTGLIADIPDNFNHLQEDWKKRSSEIIKKYNKLSMMTTGDENKRVEPNKQCDEAEETVAAAAAAATAIASIQSNNNTNSRPVLYSITVSEEELEQQFDCLTFDILRMIEMDELPRKMINYKISQMEAVYEQIRTKSAPFSMNWRSKMARLKGKYEEAIKLESERNAEIKNSTLCQKQSLLSYCDGGE